ncbi:IS1380 family transposase [Micromonospora sp. WMMA1363]|uniref:IS1380 family transposase n=1 Tax=Micromonospora sp. WMMA1363 TaxID=3053985 RepID=UPI00259C6F41|nr:IS1380 family transposase [Micromonospora sp. WMMA1363]MDM4718467.1 IS1380 family transposase [Micromonospora sp. WMMA1363]MDM4718468.1 IS1380 family transposase [Micromonospora sp. WMMA1363]MDM4718696.1 IS1380 family transposase [Micromonospora sp. WMMA1363]MDM4719654.1 IS1380 family transposase [Micromonospora sp. WMMA1363]MDM4719789.1 IS1380 family transposase [Micromonospora sp. WMMA1363]
MPREGTCQVKSTGTRPKIIVSSDGRGVVGHAGARLLADIADVTGLTGGFSEALARLRQRQGGHDPGRVAVDLAVMIADGGEAISDLAVLRDQAGLFGAVASDPTAWRVLSGVDDAVLARLRMARAAARELAWAQSAETRDGLPVSMAAGAPVSGLVLDLDASIVICHSEKEQASKTWKKTFGYHPLFCFLDNTREALSGLLRAGRAGSNTTADHISVLDDALAQIPDVHRYGTDILVRSDSAGCTYGFLRHIRSLREHGMNTFFSVGVAIGEAIRDAIKQAAGHPEQWVPALNADGQPRDGAQVCEITGLLPADLRANYPDGTRFIVRRERPHPGAQLSLFDTIEGFRHQVMATDTGPGNGSIQHLEARHRAHARVEDRIRTGKDTGFGRFPSRVFAINAAWLELALCAIDLLAWTQHLLLDGDLATAEPKTLRYRLLHVAARITRSARRTKLRIAEGWPWADQLVTAFDRLAVLPQPVT